MYIQHQRRAARMGEVMETQVKSCKWNKDTTRELLDCILESIIIPPHSQAFVSISRKAYPSFRARQIIARIRIGASLLLAEASAVLCHVCVHAKFTRGMHPASSLRVCHIMPPTGHAQNSYMKFSLTAYRVLHYVQMLRGRFPGIWVTSVSPGDQSSYLHHAFGIDSRSKLTAWKR